MNGKPTRRFASGGSISGQKTGVLFGVGVGPGDPELVTLKAARLIRAADVLAYPALPGVDSFARSIVADLAVDARHEIVVEVPMVTARGPAQEAYDQGAEDIARELVAGRDVVFLCEGDPFLYGSFMYLHARLAKKHDVEVVPGVSSVMAAAARVGLPLVARNERLTVLPGPLPEAELRARIDGAESLVIMKVGRHLNKIRSVLDGLGLTAQAVYVERVGLDGEVVCPLARAPAAAAYFSMILLVKGADPWL